jgi:farnesyl-diphosphate farnesyltransferase
MYPVDSQWQNEHLNKVSRTFALSIEYLPQPLEEYTSMQYLLCRVPDTIEDAHHIESKQKKELLNLYEAVLHPGKKERPQDFITAVEPYSKNTDDWNLVMETPRLISTFRDFPPTIQTAITPWARELTNGMLDYSTRQDDSVGVRIQTADDLEKYCYYVAGTVGHMIIDTLIATESNGGYDMTELHQNARNYGIFLQHINIAKDVYDDYKSEDSVYIPKNILERYDVEQNNVTKEDNKKGVTKSIEDVLDITENFIHGAEQFLEQIQDIDDKSYVGWSIPYVLAVATMRELRQNTDNIVSEETVKIEREEVASIVSALEEKDHAADEIRSIVSKEPYHEYEKSDI